MSQIHIACTIDNNYVQHCGVMLSSLFKNNIVNTFKINIISNDLSVSNVELLRRLISDFDHEVDFLKVNESKLSNAPINKHISLATYYRILIPEIIDKDIKKILFLDSDIIIRCDILSLWNTDISDHSLAAVVNPGQNTERLKGLGISKPTEYFNAGILLINLEWWRNNSVTTKALSYLWENSDKLLNWDQDVLNATLNGTWLQLHPKWNVQMAFFKNTSIKKFTISPKELKSIKQNPYIIHFTGENKPWYKYYRIPYKQEYYKYLSMTVWKEVKPIKKVSFLLHLKNIIYSNLFFSNKFDI